MRLVLRFLFCFSFQPQKFSHPSAWEDQVNIPLLSYIPNYGTIVEANSIPLGDDGIFDFYVLPHLQENIEELAAEEEQPQEESSNSETTVSDNMLSKNFLEIIAPRKHQREGESTSASQAIFGSTASDKP